MKKIEAIIRPEFLQEVQDALDGLGVSGLSLTEVMGCGRSRGYAEHYRGTVANISLLPKLKIETVVPDDIADAVVDAVVAAARTGELGDGRVFVSDIEQAVRISSGERGPDTLRGEQQVGWGH
jgi:nitrogen regulatory protein P-II 1